MLPRLSLISSLFWSGSFSADSIVELIVLVLLFPRQLFLDLMLSCFVMRVAFPPWLSSRDSLPRFPGVLDRRLRGKGRAFASLSTAHDCPSGELIIHHSWTFLSLADRLHVTSASPSLLAYAKLRWFATTRPCAQWSSLSAMAPISEASSSLSKSRAYLLAAALLVVDFDVGDLIRWLGGVYTHDHIPMEPIRAAVAEAKGIPRPPGYPVIDFARALHVLEHGAPISASYTCSRTDVLHRNLYDNHNSIAEEAPAVMEKIVSECNNHFLLALPRWVWRFIYGLFLSPIGFVLRKDKGRVVVDPSTHVLPDCDSGALNDGMNEESPDDVPPTFYASAQLRHWAHIWNVRIGNPSWEILLYKDDINSAFHRVRYHPDIAAAFAYVWGEWLILSVGVIFGAKSSPGWFCLVSELRAFLAEVSPSLPESPILPLVSRINVPSQPSPALVATFAKAAPDSINPGKPLDSDSPTHHSTFVDDNLMAEVAPRIQRSIQRSSAACYLLFGHPRSDLTPSLSEKKFVPAASWRMEQLGFDIDTRSMRVIYPVPKRSALLDLLRDDWYTGARKSQRQIATLLGHLRTAATILPLGSYFSIRLQQWLNSCLQASLASTSAHADRIERVKTAWRSRRCFFLPAFVARDLSLVAQTLRSNLADMIWSRPIGLLVPRCPHVVSYTDASYEGLGGCSYEFNLQWRISAIELSQAGWPVLTQEPPKYSAFPPDKLHINVLEFVAVFIQTWIVIKVASSRSPPPGGWRFHFKSDNTSALGWMSHASRTRRSTVQNLARAYAALLTFVSPASFAVSSSHIPGVHNTAADALSRPLQFPSLQDVHSLCPELATCLLYRPPSELLSHLFWLVSQPATGEQLESATIELQQVALPILDPGVKPEASKISLLPTPARRKRARSSRRTPRKSRKGTA